MSLAPVLLLASGKGGTGKTTLALASAVHMTAPVLVRSRANLSPLARRTMTHARTALLLAVATLTLGCSSVAVAQTPKPVATDPWPAIAAADARQDYATKLRLLRPLAAQGDAYAQYNLGVAYAYGEGVAQDAIEAVRWYRLAAAQGNAVAQFNLGSAYENGEGVAQDAGEAVRWYRLAAAQGYASAQNNLGLKYNSGRGVIQDYQEAVRWWRLAATQGNARAQVNVGVAYANGEGVAQDATEAVRWYRLAAAQGDAGALYNLGAAYAEGEGVAQDVVRAHMWINIAASVSSGEAAKKRVEVRNILAERMTPAQLERAQELARQCQASDYKRCGEEAVK